MSKAHSCISKKIMISFKCTSSILPNKMRDERFIAVHRGGPLKKEEHRQLIKWACDCVGHAVAIAQPELRSITT
jgi:hypothetical protein